MELEDHPKLKARGMTPDEAETIRRAWFIKHPDASSIPLDEAERFLDMLRGNTHLAVKRIVQQTLIQTGGWNRHLSLVFRLLLSIILALVGLLILGDIFNWY